jgi:adhesin transport system membrane fusion protein
VFAVLFAWAAVADVETVTRAEGRVVPSARLQTIQNLEGGIVEVIHIKQGAQVDAGQMLVTLSAVQTSSGFPMPWCSCWFCTPWPRCSCRA